MPIGVCVGVEFALSTLVFLDEDRGVILLLKKVATGVGKSSFRESVGDALPSWGAPFRGNGLEVVETAEPAILGVNGALLSAFVVDAFKVGRVPLEGPFCFSYGGIALPLLVLRGVPFCVTRIMALLSRCW